MSVQLCQTGNSSGSCSRRRLVRVHELFDPDVELWTRLPLSPDSLQSTNRLTVFDELFTEPSNLSKGILKDRKYSLPVSSQSTSPPVLPPRTDSSTPQAPNLEILRLSKPRRGSAPVANSSSLTEIRSQAPPKLPPRKSTSSTTMPSILTLVEESSNGGRVVPCYKGSSFPVENCSPSCVTSSLPLNNSVASGDYSFLSSSDPVCSSRFFAESQRVPTTHTTPGHQGMGSLSSPDSWSLSSGRRSPNSSSNSSIIAPSINYTGSPFHSLSQGSTRHNLYTADLNADESSNESSVNPLDPDEGMYINLLRNASQRLPFSGRSQNSVSSQLLHDSGSVTRTASQPPIILSAFSRHNNHLGSSYFAKSVPDLSKTESPLKNASWTAVEPLVLSPSRDVICQSSMESLVSATNAISEAIKRRNISTSDSIVEDDHKSPDIAKSLKVSLLDRFDQKRLSSEQVTQSRSTVSLGPPSLDLEECLNIGPETGSPQSDISPLEKQAKLALESTTASLVLMSKSTTDAGHDISLRVRDHKDLGSGSRDLLECLRCCGVHEDPNLRAVFEMESRHQHCLNILCDTFSITLDNSSAIDVDSDRDDAPAFHADADVVQVKNALLAVLKENLATCEAELKEVQCEINTNNSLGTKVLSELEGQKAKPLEQNKLSRFLTELSDTVQLGSKIVDRLTRTTLSLEAECDVQKREVCLQSAQCWREQRTRWQSLRRDLLCKQAQMSRFLSRYLGVDRTQDFHEFARRKWQLHVDAVCIEDSMNTLREATASLEDFSPSSTSGPLET